MCKELLELMAPEIEEAKKKSAEEAETRGEKRGEKRGEARGGVKALLGENYSTEEIAAKLGLSLEEVNAIVEEIHSTP